MTCSNRTFVTAALGAVSLAALSFAAVRAADAGSAARGADLFSVKCASCHGAGLTGGEFGPPLKGSTFISHWQGKEPGALASFIGSRMPPSAAGTLTAEDASDLAAYVQGGGGGAAPPPAPAPEAAAAPAPAPASTYAPPRAATDEQTQEDAAAAGMTSRARPGG